MDLPPAVVEAALHGRRVFILDGKRELPIVEAQGDGGLYFKEAPSHQADAKFLMSLLPGTGDENDVWTLALNGDATAIACLARLFGEAQRREHGGPNRPGAPRRARPVYLSCIGSAAACRLMRAMCEAAARETGGEVRDCLTASDSFALARPGANRTEEKNSYEFSTLVADAPAVAALAGRPVVVVTDVLRTGGALDAAVEALRQAAQDVELEIEKAALFRRVSSFHQTMTTREPSSCPRSSPSQSTRLTRLTASSPSSKAFSSAVVGFQSSTR